MSTFMNGECVAACGPEFDFPSKSIRSRNAFDWKYCCSEFVLISWQRQQWARSCIRKRCLYLAPSLSLAWNTNLIHLLHYMWRCLLALTQLIYVLPMRANAIYWLLLCVRMSVNFDVNIWLRLDVCVETWLLRAKCNQFIAICQFRQENICFWIIGQLVAGEAGCHTVYGAPNGNANDMNDLLNQSIPSSHFSLAHTKTYLFCMVTGHLSWCSGVHSFGCDWRIWI